MVRKFSDYISIMLIAPVLLIAASSATVFVQSRITGIVAELSILGPLAALLLLAIRFLPYCVLWILFSFIYVVMPNTRVHVKSGVFAGIVAGTIFQLWQGLYIVMQIGASKYGAIYGSFAALPLFLTWLQISWIIVLLGAEFSFAHQNVDTYELEPDCLAVSPGFKKTLSVWIAGLVVKRFVAGDEPWTANRISREREIPIRLVNEILYDLAGARVLAPVRSGDEKMDAYVPAQDPERLTVAFVLDALDSSGRETLPIPAAPELEKIQNAVRAMRDRIRELPQNMLLKEM
jgi:membrane protein